MSGKISVLALLVYFLAGNILLPCGDFSSLPDLPKMYRDCKASEDPDMDLPDFIFEHLLAVNILTGYDEHDPNEKPHQPVKFTHQAVQLNITAEQVKVKVKLPLFTEEKQPVYISKACSSGYLAYVFRPPVV